MKKNTSAPVWFNEAQLSSLDLRRRFIAYLRLAEAFPQCQWLWEMQLEARASSARWSPWRSPQHPHADALLASPNWDAILAAPDRTLALKECMARAPQACTARADATVASSVSELGRLGASRRIGLSYSGVDARVAAHRSRSQLG